MHAFLLRLWGLSVGPHACYTIILPMSYNPRPQIHCFLKKKYLDNIFSIYFAYQPQFPQPFSSIAIRKGLAPHEQGRAGHSRLREDGAPPLHRGWAG